MSTTANRPAIAAILLTLSLWPQPGAATGMSPAKARIYSDFCIDPATADVSGTRATVLTFSDGTYVAFQLAEGSFLTPVMAKADYNAKTGALHFVAAESSETLSFAGKLTDSHLAGRVTWRTPQYRPFDIDLKRVTDGRERHASCR